jgi:pimeloyl-ACP methyl ester carboxylesterase
VASPKPVVVLLHGITSSGRAWSPLVGELSRHFEVRTPTAIGHRGGRPPGPQVTLTDIVDDAEKCLDDEGLDRPILVGHSLGGYTAIELARRGRASAAIAISPAGFWEIGDGTALRVMHGVRRSVRIARAGAPLLKAVVSTATGRRYWMRAAVRNPESLSAHEARAVIEDQAGCVLTRGLMIADHEIVGELDPLPCPMTVAWAEHDEVLPMATYARTVRARLPQAQFVVLPGVGHAAMVDDPELVIGTILGAYFGRDAVENHQ